MVRRPPGLSAAFVASSIVMLMVASSPTVTATPYRVAIFCDEPGPMNPVYILDEVGVLTKPLRCGVNFKETVTSNCSPVAPGVWACTEVLTPGNIVLVGFAVSNPVLPDLCQSSPSSCFGVNAGYWNEDPSYVYGCVAWVENPGPDAFRVCARPSASGEVPSLCLISPIISNPICWPQ